MVILTAAVSLATIALRAQQADNPAFFRQPHFVRADANADGEVDVSDVIFTLLRLFGAAGGFPCPNAADSNADLSLDVSDTIFSLGYLFRDGPEPPAPGVNCGADARERSLSCEEYSHCPADPEELKLITHVLNRITFGPTEELLLRIQSRKDLIDYIDEQLAAPDSYDQSRDEPNLHRGVESLRIGFDGEETPARQVDRLKGMLFLDALHSDWQLLHVLTRFWNNHFHTQINAIRGNFFSGRGRGGGALRGDDTIFNAADRDSSGGISQSEWDVFRQQHPGAITWDLFGGRRNDGVITPQEFRSRQVAYWKYRNQNQQFAVAGDLERREYNVLRRLAFETFSDLLRSSAHSAAQVIYLDGVDNTVREPNENYGREYLELFSLGVDHVYTQRDIEALAKVLTGWTVAWVRRDPYDPDDINFTGHPEANRFQINLREPRPLRFPRPQNWDDDVYTWAFVVGNPSRPPQNSGHDWGRKDLFLRQYGGVDSLGNPVSTAAQVRIAANSANRTIPAILAEFELVHNRVVSLRDCAKFISTKLIHLFVTDDLSALAKTRDMPGDLRQAFDTVDQSGDGTISRSEWGTPVPIALPNGRPLEIFLALDADEDGRITRLEYQEPDLLLDAIDAWRRTDASIREVVRTILHSDEFLSLKFYRHKVKDPFELFVSAVRALDGRWQRDQVLDAGRDLSLAGMELFNFGDPTGESELGYDWMHTIGMLERLKYLNRGASPVNPNETSFAWNPFALRSRWDLDTAERTVDLLTQIALGGDVQASHRQLAIAAYNGSPANRLRATSAFVLSLPDFQKQ